MIIALLIGAADVQPSKSFVQGCYERATTQAETNFCAAGAQEADKHLIEDAQETACMDADQSQQGMNMCAGAAFERADTALNAEWAKVTAAYKGDAAAKKLLLEGQRAWLKYRDAQCQMSAYDSIGGSIWPLLNSGCLGSLTRQRTQELVVMLEGEGN
ncbi:MAG: DUF1311 domain-containing protein [Sphingomonas sp.]|nr:DUF1311 domain-containing protein [Sphingomonas sp.]